MPRSCSDIAASACSWVRRHPTVPNVARPFSDVKLDEVDADHLEIECRRRIRSSVDRHEIVGTVGLNAVPGVEEQPERRVVEGGGELADQPVHVALGQVDAVENLEAERP